MRSDSNYSNPYRAHSLHYYQQQQQTAEHGSLVFLRFCENAISTIVYKVTPSRSAQIGAEKGGNVIRTSMAQSPPIASFGRELRQGNAIFGVFNDFQKIDPKSQMGQRRGEPY